MKASKLSLIDAKSHQKVNRVLAEARRLRPSQVVVWYGGADGRTGVLVSDGTDRVKAMGGLTAAAYDVWNS